MSNAVQRILAKKSQKSRVPVTGSLELTLRCNLDCDHCYLGDDRKRQEWDTNEVKTLLDEMAQAGVLMLTLTGGEVLLRPDFEEIYRYAHGLGFLLSIFTNGVLLRDRHIDLFVERPPRRIEVSLYGTSEQSYQKFTHRKVSFKNLHDTLKKMREKNLPLILKSVASVQLRPQLKAMRAFAQSLDIPFRFATVVYDALDGKEAVKKERPDAAKSFEAEAEHYVQGRQLAHRDTRVFSCGAGRVSFYISPDGYLGRCSMLKGPVDRKINLRQSSFAEAWERLGDGLETLLPKSHPCRSCDIRHLCQRCPATDSPDAQISMCELAHHRAQKLGHTIAEPVPMRHYLKQKNSLRILA